MSSTQLKQRDTHVLLDEEGSPVLKGTLREMEEQEKACRSAGIIGASIVPIQGYNWAIIGLGD